MDEDQAKALGNQAVAAIKTYVKRALAPFAERLATAELRVGAMSMAMGSGHGAKFADVEDLIKRLNALGDLEARIKALEEKGIQR
jgi:hypothetical protein